ncbi:MAG: hypothetical protein P8Y58_05845 [Novosphingobium sp.]
MASKLLKRTRTGTAVCLAVLTASPALAGDAETAPVIHRIEAPEARQGVASDGTFVYAINNATIAKYRIADGKRVAEWHGDPALYPHINSCTLAEKQLVCAASNHPGVPQLSSIEFFDPATLKPVRSISLGMAPGSLTVLNRHDGHWWAIFANYDGKDGEPVRDHRYTLLARLDEDFRIDRGWAFPAAVLELFKPMSASGASWGPGGHLYVSGHDRPEVYVLDLPAAGSVLALKGTVPLATHGQAIDFDPREPSLLWSIDRPSRTVIASRIEEQR